jgi:magnesium transporter
MPQILTRASAVLLNLVHLKVLIQRDRVLIFDSHGSQPSRAEAAFIHNLQCTAPQKGEPGTPAPPYELRALEAALSAVSADLENELNTLRQPVLHVLMELEETINRENLRTLLILSKRLSTLEQQVRLMRDTIDEVLEDTDMLAALYLTEVANWDMESTVSDAEFLFESYYNVCDEIVQDAKDLVSSVKNTEDM